MIVQPAKRIQTVEEYYFSTKLREIEAMRQRGVEVINLGIGSPDLPPPAETIRELIAQSREDQNHAYQSYRGIPAFRLALANWYARYYQVELDPEQEILPLMGSKEGIMHIAMTFLEPGGEALVPDPGYPTYAAASKLAGASVRTYALQAELGWMPDLEALRQTDLSRVKIMWVNYPHMPTGTNGHPELFRQLVTFAKEHQLLLVNDNPYSFILNEQPRSIFSTPGAKEVALELNSLSKSFNMAGWRIGCLCGASEYLQEVLRFKSNMDSGMFKPAQLAAVKALELDEGWFRSINDVYAARRARALELFDDLNCRVQPGQVGMFLWAAVPKSYADGNAFSDEILSRAGVFLTPGGIFGEQGRGYVRLSLCSSEAVLGQAQFRLQGSIKIAG